MDLNLKIPIGLNVPDIGYTRDVELLKANAISEEVFTRKTPEKPYSYIADIIAVSLKSLGGFLIGAAVREQYLKDTYVTLPDIVKKISLADSNTLLLEIHRRTWEKELRKQNIICMFCSKSMKADIDLEKINFELEKGWMILTEGVQTILRKKGVKDPYSLIASLSRGAHIGKNEWQDWIFSLPIDVKDKEMLGSLTPQNYIGLAKELTEKTIREIRRSK